MAFYDLVWYCNAGDQSTTGYYAVAKRPQNTAVVAGQLCRQFTVPTVGNERVWICTIAGTTANTTDASWVLTRGSATVDGTATWREVTGTSAVNGDNVNTPTWAMVKAGGISLGNIIKRSNNASYQMCIAAGSMGASEPAFSDVAGAVTADSTSSWVCLGPVGNFTGGQAPHARLANACTTTWWTNSNIVYIGDNHAESQASAISIAPSGAFTDNNRILCHNHSGSYPPAASDLTFGAIVSNTSGNLTFNPGGSWYLYGIIFRSASFILFSTSSSFIYFDNCSMQITGSGSLTIQIGSGLGGTFIFNNTTVRFASTAQGIDVEAAQFIWQNTGQILAAGSSVPSSLIGQNVNGRLCMLMLEALDLSQITGNIFAAFQAVAAGVWTIKDCKLNASAIFFGGAGGLPTNPGHTIQLVRCDSVATGYKSARYLYEGSEVTETSITRVGGAVDPAGQAQSRKIVTTATPAWPRPFRAEPYAIWNPRTAANVVVTVYGLAATGALPNNDDIWMEVEYLTLNTAPPSNTALNPGDKEGHITLSGGNLTATGTAGWVGFVRASDAKSAGKFYFEMTFNASAANSGVGVTISSISVSAAGGFASAGTGQCGIVSSGSVFADGSTFFTVGGVGGSSISFGTITSGTVICIAIDLTAKLMWFRLGAAGNWNNSAARDPAAGTGGISIPNVTTAYPSIAFGGADTIIANFGSSAFTGSAPSGFTAGWPVVVVPGPLGVIVNTTKSNVLAASAPVASDSSSWNNTAYSSLDPSTVTNVTLSNNNLTATSTASTNMGVRGLTARVTGKYYFEVTLGSVVWTSNNASIGLIPSNVSYATAQAGSGGGTTELSSTGSLFSNNTNLIAGFGAFAANDVIGIAVDLGARRAWFRKNGGNWNLDVTANPATGAAGTIPVVMVPTIDFAPLILFGSFGAAGESATINFGATSFANAAPSGFGAWPPYMAFKLVATLSSPQPGFAGYIHVRPKIAKPSTTYYIDPQINLS